MSEPITRAEFRDFLIHKERVDLLHPGTSPALIFDSWCEQHRTESASPPRVPRPSAQFAKVGVQSGPGQPIDLAAQLENDASAWEEAALAADELDHAPEGMRETAALERAAAAGIRRLRAESESRYRAGVEAALQAIETMLVTPSRSASQYTVLNEAYDAIRALADAPPVDPLLAGLEHVRDALGRGFFARDISEWLDREIAARKGG